MFFLKRLSDRGVFTSFSLPGGTLAVVLPRGVLQCNVDPIQRSAAHSCTYVYMYLPFPYDASQVVRQDKRFDAGP